MAKIKQLKRQQTTSTGLQVLDLGETHTNIDGVVASSRSLGLGQWCNSTI